MCHRDVITNWWKLPSSQLSLLDALLDAWTNFKGKSYHGVGPIFTVRFGWLTMGDDVFHVIRLNQRLRRLEDWKHSTVTVCLPCAPTDAVADVSRSRPKASSRSSRECEWTPLPPLHCSSSSGAWYSDRRGYSAWAYSAPLLTFLLAMGCLVVSKYDPHSPLVFPGV